MMGKLEKMENKFSMHTKAKNRIIIETGGCGSKNRMSAFVPEKKMKILKYVRQKARHLSPC